MHQLGVFTYWRNVLCLAVSYFVFNYHFKVYLNPKFVLFTTFPTIKHFYLFCCFLQCFSSYLILHFHFVSLSIFLQFIIFNSSISWVSVLFNKLLFLFLSAELFKFLVLSFPILFLLLHLFREASLHNSGWI